MAKHWVTMFGSAEEMMQQRSSEWIADMIRFMTDLNEELKASGELVFAEGLEDPRPPGSSTARPARSSSPTGRTPSRRQSVIGFWVLDTADDQRLLEIVGRIAAKIEGPLEVRAVGQEPEL